MGCLKLSYYNDERALGKRPVFSVADKAKNASGSEICKDYYAGGMITPRTTNFNLNSYLFGYNGMEKDNEFANIDGSYYTTEFREYDSRICRWLSPDPVIHPWESPYAAFSNNPILNTDPKR